ncbi:hypothetical protein [Ruania rhizosphaerae]|uniref:DUF7848 domain-containing protein n=1 Tax=Ruania rhizosphaerae TaxID=1840413 RepID=UPI001358A141|nr:hypothetical protein [Ruania rhizosphaerae]
MSTTARPYRLSRDTGTVEHTHNRRGHCRIRIICGTCGKRSRRHRRPAPAMLWAIRHINRNPGCGEWIEP